MHDEFHDETFMALSEQQIHPMTDIVRYQISSKDYVCRLNQISLNGTDNKNVCSNEFLTQKYASFDKMC